MTISTRIEHEHYQSLRESVIQLGYGSEIEWAQTVQLVADPLTFWREYSWVVINSGMKNQVARGIWEKVRPVVEAGGSASEVFGHKGKSDAIDRVFATKETLLAQFLQSSDRMEFLWGLPWIGETTRWHLAKNFGLDCAKPDRHLLRIAGKEGVEQLCDRLAKESGDRVGTVDLVLWRASNLGLLDTMAIARERAAAEVPA